MVAMAAAESIFAKFRKGEKDRFSVICDGSESLRVFAARMFVFEFNCCGDFRSIGLIPTDSVRRCLL